MHYLSHYCTTGFYFRYDPAKPGVTLPWEDNSGTEVQLPFQCPQMKIANIGAYLFTIII